MMETFAESCLRYINFCKPILRYFVIKTVSAFGAVGLDLSGEGLRKIRLYHAYQENEFSVPGAYVKRGKLTV